MIISSKSEHCSFFNLFFFFIQCFPKYPWRGSHVQPTNPKFGPMNCCKGVTRIKQSGF